MLALLVIKAEPGTDTGLGLGDAGPRVRPSAGPRTGSGIELDLLVFEAAPQPLDEDIVPIAAPGLRRGRLLPSMLIVIA